jgi:hypothetical protein
MDEIYYLEASTNVPDWAKPAFIKEKGRLVVNIFGFYWGVRKTIGGGSLRRKGRQRSRPISHLHLPPQPPRPQAMAVPVPTG